MNMATPTLEEQVQARIQEAIEKDIFGRAEAIVKTLGKITSPSDRLKTFTGYGESTGDYRIPETGVTITYWHETYRDNGDWETKVAVFSGPEVFVATESHRHSSGVTKLSIQGYIPGVWEQALALPYMAAQIRLEREKLSQEVQRVEQTPDPRVAFGIFERA